MTGVVTTAGGAMIAAGVASAGLGEEYKKWMNRNRNSKKDNQAVEKILEYIQPAERMGLFSL